MPSRNPPTSSDLTRRSLLGGAVIGAGALALGRPNPAFASAGTLPAVFSVSASEGWARARRSSDGWLVSAPIVTGPVFALVGLQWEDRSAEAVELRVRDQRGRWSRWVGLGPDHGHGPDATSPSGLDASLQLSAPVWTGPSAAVQLRAHRPSHRGLPARLHLVRVETSAPQTFDVRASAAAGGLAGPVLSAGPGQPRIVSRQAWGAGLHPSRAPGYGDVRLAFVHHTESANAYGPGESPAMLRSIFHYHRDVRGWHDIGYNFLVDRFGRIFEGRKGGIDEPVVGAQAGGYNLVSTGVAMLGSYSSIPVSASASRALSHLLAWKLSLHGVPVLGGVTVRVSQAGSGYSRFPAGARVHLKRVSGHRDGDSTDCPGNALYAELPRLRTRTAALAQEHGVLTLAQQRATPAGALTVSGRLTLARAAAAGARTSEAPISGARVEIQVRERRGERTVATAITAPDGSWSARIAAPPGVALRALYRGEASRPAVISRAIDLRR